MGEEMSELMMAAIAAVLSATQADGDDPAQVARQPGSPWSQDHRRQMTGRASLMNARAGRSPWR
ncbi:MAG: hypothetical protein VXZ04_01630 [Candidatus Thermoplasmatota archaeon]|nr:hypothetical protein [Euryarchaeota archaeon]MEC7443533.1 hypothetical protein [Candidatus Thermoplasmatota archaeon]GIR76077.1 MAG: hypothetical protein CM15mP78_07760 [Candidatus Poseidoniales archaeon]MAP78765.1 hypothetical protein [Euryarchaeota archaeon]MBO95821.1 hypothetical protein [Euryarchaeota archaeon]